MNDAGNNQSIEREYIHSMVSDFVSADNDVLPVEDVQELKKEAAAKEVAAKEVADKEVADKEVAAKEVAAKEVAAKEAEAKEAEAKEAEAKEAEAKEAEAKEEVLDCYSDIECRVVQIAGLNFALPVTNIKQLVDQQEVLFEKTGYIDSGNVCINGVFVDVIDVSRVISKNTDDDIATKKVNEILLKQSHTGIVYDKEIGIEKVSLSDVCWRSDDSNNTWLAGTVLKLGFSLLDPVGILKLLTEKG